MQSIDEVDMNVDIFNTGHAGIEIDKFLDTKRKKLHIDFWCDGCGKCVNRCRQGAIHIKNNKACVGQDKCILCGYCCDAYPQFAIKIY